MDFLVNHFFFCFICFSVLDSISKRVVRPWTYFDSIYRWTNIYKEEQEYYAKIRNLTNKVMEVKTFYDFDIFAK